MNVRIAHVTGARTLSALHVSEGSFYIGTERERVLTVSGGIPPYSYRVVSGPGSVDSAGAASFAYTAPSTVGSNAEQALLKVTDAAGSSAEVAVTVAEGGSLDTSFNTTGKLMVDFANGSDQHRAIAIQPDGKILAAGFSNNGTNNVFAITRVNPDGAIDASFGTSGKALITMGSGDSVPYRIALQPDGKILLSGDAINGTSDFGLVRLDADGTLDASFGTGGRVYVDWSGGADRAYGMTLQSDGKIVVAGQAGISGVNRAGVLRLNADGSLDSTFATGGKYYDAAAANAWFKDVIQLPDGKIVAAGRVGNDVLIAQLNANGTPDTGFASSGSLSQSFAAGANILESVERQPDGKLLFAGNYGSPADFLVVRLNADGSLDSAFGTNGAALIAAGVAHDSAYAARSLSDGGILVAGVSSNGTDNDYGVCRLKQDGSLDTTFNGTGCRLYPVGPGADSLRNLVQDSSGRVILIGWASNGTNDDLGLVRIWP